MQSLLDPLPGLYPSPWERAGKVALPRDHACVRTHISSGVVWLEHARVGSFIGNRIWHGTLSPYPIVVLDKPGIRSRQPRAFGVVDQRRHMRARIGWTVHATYERGGSTTVPSTGSVTQRSNNRRYPYGGTQLRGTCLCPLVPKTRRM